jgi:Aldehyde dehydrogenase family
VWLRLWKSEWSASILVSDRPYLQGESVLTVGFCATGIISDPAAPFGGVKRSGFGREGSSLGIEEYLTVKTMTLGGMDMPLQV